MSLFLFYLFMVPVFKKTLSSLRRPLKRSEVPFPWHLTHCVVRMFIF